MGSEMCIRDSTKCGPDFASKKFNLHSKMGRVVVFRGNVYTK